MFPELNNILNSTPETCEQGKAVLLSDKQTDGSFLVHHFLSFYLKGGCKVCFLGLVQSFNHYSLVAQKLGVNLSAAREKGQLVFLEALRSSVDFMLGDRQDSTPHTLSPLQFLRKENLRPYPVWPKLTPISCQLGHLLSEFDCASYLLRSKPHNLLKSN
ncbi:elongator complex protein 6 isoform X4 [Heterodontus francisci]|uniref:elongator complex protein 6 isoform X4 n=1 Tax=Heterodontus francisci TaxID=7792 RepID=UPI00355B2645